MNTGARKRITPKRVTSYDLAVYLGVSQSIVSRCFQPDAKVSTRMRERILKGAAELGYEPNAIARSLITQRSGIVGLVAMEQTSLNVPELVTELAKGFSDRGLRLVLFILTRESVREEFIRQILQYQLEGLVAAASLSAKEVDLLRKRGISIVFYNRSFSDLPACSVSCDQTHGMRLVANRLIEYGYQSFAYFAGPDDSPVMNERKSAFLERLREFGIEDVPVLAGDFDIESGRKSMNELFRVGKLPQAVVCGNDAIAIGALEAARHELGLRVPEDIAITGFDGLGAASLPSYQITTIRQPIEQMFKATINAMIDQIGEPTLPPSRILIQGTFVSGKTAQPRTPS